MTEKCVLRSEGTHFKDLWIEFGVRRQWPDYIVSWSQIIPVNTDGRGLNAAPQRSMEASLMTGNTALRWFTTAPTKTLTPKTCVCSGRVRRPVRRGLTFNLIRVGDCCNTCLYLKLAEFELTSYWTLTLVNTYDTYRTDSFSRFLNVWTENSHILHL